MFCPGCSMASPDGAKFCKSCGMNLTVVSHALSGGGAATDPIREREYKRARKKISDGIQGSAVGLALMAAAVLIYYFLAKDKFWYAISLTIALAGLIGFFRSLGHIIDAKVGPKLLDPSLQPRATGPLSGPLPQSAPQPANLSKRLPAEIAKAIPARDPQKSQVLNKADGPRPGAMEAPPAPGSSRPPTTRISREPGQFDRLGKDDDLMSKLRN
jgi:hypothetical protein